MAALELVHLWDEFGQAKLFSSWLGWHFAALWKSSLYDSRPLQKVVKGRIKGELIRSSGKKLRVGAVDLMTGDYKTFGEGYASILDAVLASSAFPGMLTPVEMEKSVWTDGGVRSNTPIKNAIDLGATSIDVIMCSPPKVRQMSSNLKTLDIATRAIDILTDTVNTYDLDKALMYNRLVQAGVETSKREVEINIVRPAFELITDPLRFESDSLWSMRTLGEYDAEKVFGL